MIDLIKLQQKLDKLFAEESQETFEKWLQEKINSDKNDAVSDTTKADSSNEAGSKKHEQWKEDLEKECNEAAQVTNAENLAKYFIKHGASWAKSYLETNVIEPLIKEMDFFKRLNEQQEKHMDEAEKYSDSLNQEVERLKKIIEQKP